MSLQTTLAMAEAAACEQEWAAHKRHCARCAHRARIREWQWLCPEGTKIRDAHVTAQAVLAENRRLDRQPSPGQGTMF